MGMHMLLDNQLTTGYLLMGLTSESGHRAWRQRAMKFKIKLHISRDIRTSEQIWTQILKSRFKFSNLYYVKYEFSILNDHNYGKSIKIQVFRYSEATTYDRNMKLIYLESAFYPDQSLLLTILNFPLELISLIFYSHFRCPNIHFLHILLLKSRFEWL